MPQVIELSFNCWKCLDAAKPQIRLTIKPREAEIISIACPICRTPLMQVQMEAQR
jgi:hypothetical protein